MQASPLGTQRPGTTTAASSRANYQTQQQDHALAAASKAKSRSPTGHDEYDVDGRDDYDEETDEFATYSASARGRPGATQQPTASTASMKSSASKASKKSSAVKEREKNIKEIKMYYWTKVDQGDRNEVIKILSFAK